MPLFLLLINHCNNKTISRVIKSTTIVPWSHLILKKINSERETKTTTQSNSNLSEVFKRKLKSGHPNLSGRIIKCLTILTTSSNLKRKKIITMAMNKMIPSLLINVKIMQQITTKPPFLQTVLCIKWSLTFRVKQNLWWFFKRCRETYVKVRSW